METSTETQSSEALRRRCPKCLSDRVHHSHRQGAIERLLSIFGAEIRRCHACRMRQAWWGMFALRLGDSGASTQWSALLVLAVGFVFCLAVVWWVITRMPS